MTNLVVKHGPVPHPHETGFKPKEFVAGSESVMVVHTDDELLTVEEVAQLLKLPTSRVCERCRECVSDPLPRVKLGKFLRFDKNDLLVAFFLIKTQRPFVNCGFCSVRSYYNARESMRRLKRHMSGVGE